MCHYLGGGLHEKQKRVKAQSESSKSVVNSVLISREMLVFPSFLEIIRVVIETFIALVEYGAGKLFEWVARFIPYIGFLLGLIAGWLVSYLLGKFFNNKRVKRIKAKFSSLVKNARVSLLNWIKYAAKSLTA